MCEPRPGCPFPELEDPVGEERGLTVLGRVLRRRAVRSPLVGAGVAGDGIVDEPAPVVSEVVALLGERREPRLGVAFGQMADRVEAGQHTFVLAQTLVVGRDRAGIDAGVGVSEQRGPVAELARFERDVGVTGVERSAVRRRAVVHQVHAGVERRATRTAGSGLRVVAREARARDREPVEVGCSDDRMTRARRASHRATGRPSRTAHWGARGEASHGPARAGTLTAARRHRWHRRTRSRVAVTCVVDSRHGDDASSRNRLLCPSGD